MSDGSNDSGSFCDIAGCSSPATASRWVAVGDGNGRHIEVCWKHEEGELTAEDLALAD